MPDPSAVVGALLSVAKTVWPLARQVYGERRAGQAPLTSTDLLDEILDVGLAHITRVGGMDETWWRKLLDRVAHPFVAPDFIQIPAVQDWLCDAQVGADIKAIAKARILGNQVEDPTILERLAESYSAKTGEAVQLATGPIDVVIAIVAASHLARLSGESEALGAMVQAGAQESHVEHVALGQQLDALKARFELAASDQHVSALADDIVNRDLTLILKRRVIAGEGSRAEIRELALRVQEGQLRSASLPVRARVLYWAARIHSGDPNTADLGQTYRDELLRLTPDSDVRVIDALLAKSRGQGDESLRSARVVDTPDGRSVLFLLLCEVSGREVAVRWFMEQLEPGPELLSGHGWRQVAVTLAEENRWEESAGVLARTGSSHLDECPDLAYVEGTINAGLLLPEDLRQFVLKGPIAYSAPVAEGHDADQRRARATERFGLAVRLMEEIGFAQRAEAAREWLLWLRLTHPDRAVTDAAREEIRAAMRNGKQAVDRIALASMFKIEFDPEPLQRYLRERELTGGLEDSEVLAKFRLIEARASRREFIEFIEREEQALLRVIPPDALMGKMVEALVKEGEIGRAESVLDARAQVFDPDDLQRVRSAIADARGEPVRQRLEAMYAQTGGLMDLRNLVNHLGRVGDWSAARPLLGELFRHERTIENAYRVLQAMDRDPDRDDPAILRFMEANEDLVARSQDLRALKGWVLFRLGRINEARALNDVLVGARTSSNDLALDINIAVRSGDWDHFAVIIEREWPRRETHGPKMLLRLAAIAAETGDVRRGTELARLAAEKAPDQAQVLIAAYTLSTQLGREGKEMANWLQRAAALSSSDGPLHRFHLRQLVEEFMPAQAERSRNVNNLVTRGQLPIHAAAAMLHLQLGRILIELPLRNALIQDGRQLTAIPIISGARQPVQANPDWILGMDITSMMVLSNIGLLEQALGAFRQIVLPPSSLELLLSERREARFHQPSRIKAASEVHGLVDAGKLKVLESNSLPRVEISLGDQVGRELGELLQLAHQRGGVVIHPKPIYKLRTYLEEEANLGEYQQAVISPSALVRALRQAGVLDQQSCAAALGYLSTAEPQSETATAPASVLDRAIYLDGLAVTYLQTAGILATLATAIPHVFVHPSMRDEVHALLRENQSRIELEEHIEDIRVILNHALASGQAILAPQSKWTRDDEDQLLVQTPTLMHFLKDSCGCDAVCIDDRCANRHLQLTDQTGRHIPLLCSLDVLCHLQSQGILTRTDLFAKLHTLRRQGFMFIPTSRGELGEAIRTAVRAGGSEELTESAELRAIRIGLLRARTLEMVRQPVETSYLDSLRQQCLIVLADLWRDDTLTLREVITASDWIWRKLMPSPVDWRATIEDAQAVMPPRLALAHLCAAILQLTAAIKEERRIAFRGWVESRVIEPLLPANSELVDDIAKALEVGLERIVEELGHDTR